MCPRKYTFESVIDETILRSRPPIGSRHVSVDAPDLLDRPDERLRVKDSHDECPAAVPFDPNGFRSVDDVTDRPVKTDTSPVKGDERRVVPTAKPGWLGCPRLTEPTRGTAER